MIAVDTNVIVRLIAQDDEQQVALALALAAREELFVSLTVLMEAEWVLRSRYGYPRASIASALTNLRALPWIRCEAEGDVDWALDRYATGGELADYLHLAAVRPIGRFATFERRLAQRAGKDAPVTVEILS